MTQTKSKGHIGWTACANGKYRLEYFVHENGELYRAADYGYIDVNGYRSGARWEGPAHIIDEKLALVGLKRNRVGTKCDCEVQLDYGKTQKETHRPNFYNWQDTGTSNKRSDCSLGKIYGCKQEKTTRLILRWFFIPSIYSFKFL